MKTIKQIADEIGVSKQAIRYWLKKTEATKENGLLLVKDNGVLLVSLSAENAIISAFAKNGRQRITDKETVKENISFDSEITVLLRENMTTLQKELETKNKLIDEQQQTINRLTDMLAVAQQSAQTAQMLHVGTMRKQLTEGGESSDELNALPMGFIERVKFVFNGK
jgi:DNA-binding transcriptional MerR regulator